MHDVVSNAMRLFFLIIEIFDFLCFVLIFRRFKTDWKTGIFFGFELDFFFEFLKKKNSRIEKKKMETTDAPQIIEHLKKTLTFTPFETRWIPCSARFVLLGQHPKSTGSLQIYELKGGELNLVHEVRDKFYTFVFTHM